MSRINFLARSMATFRPKMRDHFNFDPEKFSEVLPMATFAEAKDIPRNCVLGCDNDTGGYSTASLTHAVEDDVPCVHFHGNLSLHVSAEAKKRGMTHSGWAGFRTKAMEGTLFNRHPLWDTSLFRFLALRVKGDDRRYYVNVQVDSYDPIELWQHRLFLRSPGKWETVLIPWTDFLRTRNGKITYKKFDGMDRERIKTVGASLIERKEGPFSLYVSEIKSVNIHGFHGQFDRYTPQDLRDFMKEEEHRNQEETAAYYAWKRGEAPLGSAPTYIPPDPTPPPPDTEVETPTLGERTVRSPSDDVQSFIRTELSEDGAVPEDKPLDPKDKVDIDSIDAEDYSEQGRRLKMDAMADELESFSAGQRTEAERNETSETARRVQTGKGIREQFGREFQEPRPPRRG